MKLPEWYKVKGYYHLTAPLPFKIKKARGIIQRVTNEKYVSQYAFFPLLHINIVERKYKKIPTSEDDMGHPISKKKNRAHVHLGKNGKWEKTAKVRPLHYANHTDALIFSYYAFQLQQSYELVLKQNSDLNDAVTAYRKVPVEATVGIGEKIKHKGSVHFAKDVFQEISTRVEQNGDVIVLAFDIKSFFSTLCHEHLQSEWKELLRVNQLPKDHFNVFKAATQFSFIYRDDLRRKKKKFGRRSAFDERKLAKIRNKNGFKAYFDSAKDFREAVRNGDLHVFKNQFRDKSSNKMIGIPQGLPISATLANLYLLKFDQSVVKKLVKESGCFYRRYSDDIILLCQKHQIEWVTKFIEDEMKKYKVQISTEKTETFLFAKNTTSIESFKWENNEWKKGLPLTYLGFEFYGDKILIKSTNLSKFYRRMIYSVKSKCRRAKKIAERDGTEPALFINQLTRIYRNINLDKAALPRKKISFHRIETGEYRLKSKTVNAYLKGNYFSYVRRSAEIMNEPRILNQIKKEKSIFNKAIQKHLTP